MPNISKQYDHVGAPDRAQMHTHTNRPSKPSSLTKASVVNADQLDIEISLNANLSFLMVALGASSSAVNLDSTIKKAQVIKSQTAHSTNA